ncbi:unnamed protein product [Vicia faba]|uniref:Uncharacterized protein n=1 Tax=Vicia faba TaxID=3906 RepID=A0AAV0Z6S6_VICFA|nr:unnamed protein product [Vicia faba]
MAGSRAIHSTITREAALVAGTRTVQALHHGIPTPLLVEQLEILHIFIILKANIGAQGSFIKNKSSTTLTPKKTQFKRSYLEETITLVRSRPHQGEAIRKTVQKAENAIPLPRARAQTEEVTLHS